MGGFSSMFAVYETNESPPVDVMAHHIVRRPCGGNPEFLWLVKIHTTKWCGETSVALQDSIFMRTKHGFWMQCIAGGVATMFQTEQEANDVFQACSAIAAETGSDDIKMTEPAIFPIDACVHPDSNNEECVCTTCGRVDIREELRRLDEPFACEVATVAAGAEPKRRELASCR